MKGLATEVLYRVLLGVILLGFFIYVIYRMTGGLSYELEKRIAVDSVQDLANTINLVCLTGNDQDIEIYLPQTLPEHEGLKDYITQYFSTAGDPQFITYFEAFPPGEEYAWSQYVGVSMLLAIIPIRVPGVGGSAKIAQFGSKYSKFTTGISQGLLKKMGTTASQAGLKQLYIAAVPNVILRNAPSWGRWYGKKYVYNKGLSEIDKANEKFRTCGIDSLCLKTKYELFVFPLDECKKRNITYVELSKGSAEHPTLSWQTIEDVFSVAKDKPFYLASPCKAKFKVYKTKCACSDLETIPVYEYDEKADTAVQIGERSICEKSVKKDLKFWEKKDTFDCVKLKVYSEGYSEALGGKDNFCYSSPESVKYVLDSLILVGEALIDPFVAAATMGCGGCGVVATRAASRGGMAWLETKWAWPKHPTH